MTSLTTSIRKTRTIGSRQVMSFVVQRSALTGVDPHEENDNSCRWRGAGPRPVQRESSPPVIAAWSLFADLNATQQGLESLLIGDIRSFRRER